MIRLLSKYYHTIRHLRRIQIVHQLRKIVKGQTIPYALRHTPAFVAIDVTTTNFQPSIPSYISHKSSDTFQFLNIEEQFSKGIDWNFDKHGKLWTYNLNYFEFLNQPGMSQEVGLRLINDFIDRAKDIQDGMEPFPISLRVISWIKFILRYKIVDDRINRSLRMQLEILRKNPEYHLLGNHLLENGFGLLMGGCYFNDESLLGQATEILQAQLREQMLTDGGHFELSPMYHQLLLFRMLDCINLLQHNTSLGQAELLNLMRSKARLMLGWLQQMSFSHGELPRVNDSTAGVAPQAKDLFAYASRLDIEPVKVELGESGYRSITKPNYKALVDVGRIGPDYIPGHAHSDTFNFVLHHKERALIVDRGISTYEKNDTRQAERSTASHNTVAIDGQDQSEVWGGFRVARRAKITALEIAGDRIEASHDGYQRLGVTHQRTFDFEDAALTILDEVSGDLPAAAFLHFHPDIDIQQSGDRVFGNFGQIEFQSARDIRLEEYDYAHGFNQTQKAKKVSVHFNKQLKTTISLQ